MLKHLLRSIALSLLWLCIGLSCKKEEVAPCNPRQCCGNFEYRYVQNLEGVRADIGLVGFYFKEPIMERKGITACINQWNLMDTYERTSFPNDPDPQYKYRVWGRVYQNLEVWNFGPPYEKLEVYVERIEKVK